METITDLSQHGVTQAFVSAGCELRNDKAGPAYAPYAEVAAPTGRGVTVSRSQGLVLVRVDGDSRRHFIYEPSDVTRAITSALS